MLFFSLFSLISGTKWYKPAESSYNVNQNQGFQSEIGKTFVRLPPRAKDIVSARVWELSRHSSSVSVHFLTDSTKIDVQYSREGPSVFPMMNQFGTSGVDMYAYDPNGTAHYCYGDYSFGTPATYSYNGLPGTLFEYRLVLPSYDVVNSLQIGVADASFFRFTPSLSERPLVVYGTSIAHGASPNRPGIAWTNWLARDLDLPLLNFGFQGQGVLDPAVIELVAENDAAAYVLDCQANLVFEPVEQVVSRTVAAFRQIRARRPDAPIVLVEFSGYTNQRFDATYQTYFNNMINASQIARKTLLEQGATGLYYVSAKDIGITSDDIADTVHPTDRGMWKQKEAVARQLRLALDMPKETMKTKVPVMQFRNQEFRFRQHDIVELLHKEKPRKVIIGDSITNIWGGRPVDPDQRGPDSWNEYMEKEGFINLGIGSDRIENALWRVYHDNFYNYSAETIVALIGTNNLAKSTDEEIVEGIRNLMHVIRGKQQKASIVISGLLPRRNYEERIDKINTMIEKMVEEEKWKFINPGLKLLLDSGKINEALFSDGLHPNKDGYALIAPIIGTA